MKVKIFGAGSIGNHLAHASRVLGWDVLICDINDDALERTKKSIYPGRYGKWDNGINLSHVNVAPKGWADLIIVGTPPDYHIKVAKDALSENPRAILIEKPLCCPDMREMDELKSEANAKGVLLFVGYDHSVGEAIQYALKIAKEGEIGQAKLIDAEFREHWDGIFKAHPWLNGPGDSYLGFTSRGGGSIGEHSHALHLLLYIIQYLNLGKIDNVTGLLKFGDIDGTFFDEISSINIKTDSGCIGRVIQDVITHPSEKLVKITGTKGIIKISLGLPGMDKVFISYKDGQARDIGFPKSRPDDFIMELKHIQKLMINNDSCSPLSIDLGIDVMKIINKVYGENGGFIQ